MDRSKREHKRTERYEGWKTTVASSFEEIESIRPIWEQMQRNEPYPAPDADIDRYLSVIKARGDAVQPSVVLLEHHDRPAAMIIGRLQRHQLKPRVGYQRAFCPRLRCLTVVYGGILGQPGDELCSLLVDELFKQLRHRGIDVIYFNHLRTDTSIYQAVRKTPGFFIRGHFPKVDVHWRMFVPEKIDQFYLARSRGHRHNLRRAMKEFDKISPSESQFTHYTTESEVEDFVRIAADISSKTYQNALGVGLENDEETRTLIRSAAVHGWFDGNILYAGDKPCAFQLGLRYQTIYYMVSIGYDPVFSSYKPGMILFLKVLDSLCDDSSIETIDFYFGDAEYKKRYGTEHWPEACVYIFAPRLYPILINVLCSLVEAVNIGLVYLVNKIGIVNWAKRIWRQRLIQSKRTLKE